jgi:hypothetical protein
MAQAGREQLFFKILVFLSALTAVIGIVNLANADAINLGDLGSPNYMQTIPGQAVAQMGTIPASTTAASGEYNKLDFTSSSGYDHNLTKIRTDIYHGDYWTRYDGIGFDCTYASDTDVAYFSVLNAVAVNNVYDNTYHVINQFGEAPFNILIQGQEAGAHSITGYFVKFDKDGIYLVNQFAVLDSIEYLYANSGQTIETKFDSSSGTVEVYIDGVDAGSFSGVPTGAGEYMTGIAAKHVSLQLSEIDGAFLVSTAASTDVWTAIWNLINGFNMAITQFLVLIGTMLGLTSNALVPFWLWGILVVPCLATLGLIYIQIARGD